MLSNRTSKKLIQNVIREGVDQDENNFLTTKAFRTLKFDTDQSSELPPYYVDADDTNSLEDIIIAQCDEPNQK